jgi:rod shape-determining protein MreC
MPRNKVAWRRFVFVVLIIACLALLTVSLRESKSGPVHSIQQAGVSVLSPMQSWGATIAKPFEDGYHWITTLWSAHKQAESLAAQLQQLQGKAVQFQEQADENARLRALLDFRDKGTFPAGTGFVVCRVVGKSPTQWNAWAEIDKGSADGLQIDQAVVGATPDSTDNLYGKGLVGKIVSVTAHSAQVQFISDADASVAAKVQSSRAEGIVEGSVDGDLTMNYVERDLKVDPKSIIVTSGYGGVYPAGIPIGIVSNVGEETVDTYKKIDVQPFVDFHVLEEVMVLITPANATGVTSSATTAASSSTTKTTKNSTSTTATSAR